MSIKNLVIKFINAPEANIYSSQTLYESLFYLIEKSSFDKARIVAKLIAESQLDDGGFDIGYDFLFGKGLAKAFDKEGTTPETLSITALALFLHKFGQLLDKDEFETYKSTVDLGLKWISSHQLQLEDQVAIPYAPLSFPHVHITNATSFALSAIAVGWPFANQEGQEKLKALYFKLTRFMYYELEDADISGKFWPYFYQNGSNMEKQYINDKVDNYHIAQQLYFHILANDFLYCQYNHRTIEYVSAYIASSIDEAGFIPYTKRNGKVTSKVDVWGYSSAIMAMAAASATLENKHYLELANRVNDYLFNYCVAEDYFYPIIDNESKRPFDHHFYPRSDAWVIHAVSVLGNVVELSHSKVKFCEKVYKKIEDSKFRGLENHTFSFRKKVFVKAVGLLRR